MSLVPYKRAMAPLIRRASRNPRYSRVMAARIIGTAVRKGWGAYKRRRARKRTLEYIQTRRVKRLINADKETCITNQEFYNDTLVDPGVLHELYPFNIGTGTETGGGQEKRDGQQIRVSGVRLEYCFNGNRGTSNAVRSFVRLMCVIDRNDKLNREAAGLSFFSGGGEGANASEAINFTDCVPHCTRTWRPLNSKRYIVLWQKRVALIPKFASDETIRTGKFYIPMKNRLVTYGQINGVNFNTPNIKIFWFYEQPNGTLDTKMKADIKMKTYFKNV